MFNQFKSLPEQARSIKGLLYGNRTLKIPVLIAF